MMQYGLDAPFDLFSGHRLWFLNSFIFSVLSEDRNSVDWPWARTDINRLFPYCKGGNFIFISGRGSAISSAMEKESGSIYNLVKS